MLVAGLALQGVEVAAYLWELEDASDGRHDA